MRRLSERKARRIGLRCGVPGAVLLLLIVVALAPGLVTGIDPLEQDASHRLLPPGRGHPMGTDGFGRDVFSRVVHGTSASLGSAFLGFLAAFLAGASVGLVSAYRGGMLDRALQRSVDILLGIPFLVMALVIVVALTPSAFSVGAAIAAALAAPIARYTRAVARPYLSEPWVDAARLCGAGGARIMLRHVLPNAASPLITQGAAFLVTAVTAEATLSFLGLGIPAPFPSWGRMLLEGARQYLESAPWITAFPALALLLTVMSIVMLGDALRDLLLRRGVGVRKASGRGNIGMDADHRAG